MVIDLAVPTQFRGRQCPQTFTLKNQENRDPAAEFGHHLAWHVGCLRLAFPVLRRESNFLKVLISKCSSSYWTSENRDVRQTHHTGEH